LSAVEPASNVNCDWPLAMFVNNIKSVTKGFT
jgi:hypothetical protein